MTITTMKSLCTALLLAFGTLTLTAQDKPVPPPEVPPAPALPPVPPVPAAADPTKAPTFRAPNTGLNPGTPAPAPAATGGSNLADLLDQKKAIEAEINANRKRIDVSKQRANAAQSLGKPDEAERLKAEVQDFEARVGVSRERLRQIEDEIGRAQGASSERMLEDGEEVILPSSNIELWVNEDASFNGRYQVREAGYFMLPNVGRITIAGKTVGQAEAAVRKALQATQLKRATVTIEVFGGVVKEAGPLVFLSGEFRNPKPFRIMPGTAPTLVAVMLSCGGWTERADLTKVRVMRVAGSSSGNRSMVEEVNVKKILDGAAGNLGNDLMLTEGDVIVLPSRSLDLVYVTGRVKKPGSYKLAENEKLSVYGVILQSGGFSHFAKKSDVHVLRALPDGGKAKIPVNIKDVMRGSRPDIILQPNDIVVVPEKWFSW